MISRLLRGPRPWRYGSLYLPEGSKNLGNEEYALEPGSKVRAPICSLAKELPVVLHVGHGAACGEGVAHM